MSRFPMPRYPIGWFQVAYSEELPAGAVRPLRYFGRDLVLFRTENGEPRLLDGLPWQRRANRRRDENQPSAFWRRQAGFKRIY